MSFNESCYYLKPRLNCLLKNIKPIFKELYKNGSTDWSCLTLLLKRPLYLPVSQAVFIAALNWNSWKVSRTIHFYYYIAHFISKTFQFLFILREDEFCHWTFQTHIASKESVAHHHLWKSRFVSVREHPKGGSISLQLPSVECFATTVSLGPSQVYKFTRGTKEVHSHQTRRKILCFCVKQHCF